MEIKMEAEFDLEAEDFNLDQIVNSTVDWTSSPSVPHHRIESPEIASKEATPSLELKVLRTPQVRLPRRKRNPASHHSIPPD